MLVGGLRTRPRPLVGRRRTAVAALAGGFLLLPAGASAAPNWAPTRNFPVPATDQLLGTQSVEDEVQYQEGGIANEAFLQLQSTSPPQTTIHVGTMPPGGTYADQLTIASTESAIPVGVRIAVAPDGAAVVAWLELTGPIPTTAPLRFRASYRPAGSSTWEPPVTIATDSEHSAEVIAGVVPAISSGGTAAVAVVHTASELGESRKEEVGRLDVAVRTSSGWTPAVRLSAAKVSAERPALSTDAEGNLTIAFLSRFNEGATSEKKDDEKQALVRRRSASSGSWGPAEEITPAEPAHEAFPAQLGENESGDAVMAFQYDQTVGKFPIWVVTRQGPSGAWSPLTQAVTNTLAPASAGVAPNGTDYVLYPSTGGGSTEDCAGAVRRAVGEATFTAPRCLSPAGEELQEGSLAFLGNDAYFAWRGEVPTKVGDDLIQGARWGDATPLPDAATDFDPEGVAYGRPNIVSDHQGSVVALYAAGEPKVLRAAPYDGGPPILREASVPSSATAGHPVSFSANVFDLWSGLGAGQPVWSFGDGSAPAAGSGVTHTFATPGTYTVTLAAADALGNATSDTYTITVTPPSSAAARVTV
jgi:hypothetical protein